LNKEELPEQRNESILPMYKKGNIVVIVKVYHFCQQHTKLYPTSFCYG